MSLVDRHHCATCSCAAATTEAPTISYLGWSGQGNLGDDAIHDALASALPNLVLERQSLRAREIAASVLANQRLRRHEPLLLGGGTVIGRKNWRLPLRVHMALTSTRPLFMIGAGVEDPVFQGRHSFSSDGELSRWVPLLGEFDRVTVRGPRSARLLGDVGVEAEVVGDPALLWARPPYEVEPGLMAVNLGYGSDLWSNSQVTVLKEIAPAIRRYYEAGWRFRFLIANLEDAQWSRFCVALAQLPPESYEEIVAVRPEVFLASVASCELIVGQRLHALVLAAAAGVPGIMLEYQPKCRDFMESIDSGERSFRTDHLTAGQLIEALDDLTASRVRAAATLDGAVAEHRRRLSFEVSRIASHLGIEVAP
jgi:polysaccharide pyruvyl transferase WcaK-like protein